MLRLDRRTLDYQPFYCEENVWRLLRREELAGRRAWAVIVTSLAGRLVALRQKAGRSADGFVCWDYHVFAIVDGSDERLALDLDTDLPFPCPLALYVRESFPTVPDARAQPLFRVIPASDYGARLATDRSHMRRADGSYLWPPPAWPAPGTAGTNTFLAWLDFSVDGPGKLLNLVEMIAFAGRTSLELSP